MNFDQGQFNFNDLGSEAGYQRWRDELDAQKRAFESRWGVVIGRRVRIYLTNHDKPLIGILRPVPSPNTPSNTPPKFQLKGMEFTTHEIESIVIEEDP